MISDCGMGHQFEYDVPQDVTFDISQQVTLHVGAGIIGILGDCNGDAGTIKSKCSNATLGSSESHLKPPINCLLLRPVLPQQKAHY